MRYFVYVTDGCKKLADKYGFAKAVEQLARKVEKDQSIGSWECFLPDPIIRKKLGKYRLIASLQGIETAVGSDIVVVFCGVYARGETDYDKIFLRDPETFVTSLLPEKHMLEDYVQARTVTEDVVEVEAPTEAEYEFLYDSSKELDPSDGMILESHDWVKMIRQTKYTGLLSRYYDLINRIDDGNQLGSHGGARILYRYYPEYKAKFLIAPLAKETTAEEEQKLCEKYRQALGAENEVPAWDQLLKASGRSYPALIMAADEMVWQRVQQEAGGNLALSPEEADVLKNVGFAANGETERYPLFINGRPGSGKSTILQYLFAHRLFMYLRKPQEERLPNPPVYLTYSQELLDVARKSVRAIIECNVHLATEHDIDFDSDGNSEYMNRSFREFQPFLLDMVPPEDKARFVGSGYIDFPQFRLEWDDQRKRDPEQQVRNLHPELAWHVIRTFIKGMSDSDGGYLSPEGYSELSKDHRTVSHEIFKLVFERVWEKWYRQECENGRWDSQDLTRYILDSYSEGRVEIQRYPGIYCDEAQDFTRNELELLLNLSLFSQRRLTHEEVKQVPFAFAGDPFQTLNPTGFRWDSVKAVFHEKIVRHLVRYPGRPLALNCQELSLNYRSSQAIVGVTNVIQILRGILFDMPDLQPQKTWFTTNTRAGEKQVFGNRDATPQYFNISDETFRKSLHERSDLVVILPCQQGEELEFVRKDEFLSVFAGDGGPTRNFLSPMQAKGLEFETVILYKFGWEMVTHYPDLLKPFRSETPHTGDKALPLEYYMNRLYVAASRAKKTLVVVDTKEGIEQLWANGAVANLDALVARYNKKRRKENWSVSDLSIVQPGTDIGSIEVRDNPKELAELFYKTGVGDRNSYTLRLAAMNFRRVPDEKEALRSEALAHEFEGDLLKAGQMYAKAMEKEHALRCFWKAEKYAALAEAVNLFEGSIFHKAATFRLNFDPIRPQFQPIKDFIREIRRTFELEPRFFLDPDYKDRWMVLLCEVGSSMPKIPYQGMDDRESWLVAWGDLVYLQSRGILGDLKSAMGEIAFRAGRYTEAIQTWDRTGDNRHDRYYIAKGNTLEYPDNVEWLLKAGKLEEAVRQCQGQDLKVLKAEEIKQIGNYYIDKQMDTETFELLKHLRPMQIAVNYLKLRGNRVTEATSALAAEIALSYWVDAQDWNGIVNGFESQNYFANVSHKGHDLLVNQLAMSETFTQASRADKERIGRYLRKILIQDPWENIVSIKAAGASIEKANKIIDALEFYEKIWKTKQIPATRAMQEFSQIRWVKRKMLFLETERKIRNPKKHNDEIELVIRTLKIDVKTLPEVPQLSLDDLSVASMTSGTAVERAPSPGRLDLPGMIRVNEMKIELMEMMERFGEDGEEKESAIEWLEAVSKELLEERPKMAIVREGVKNLKVFAEFVKRFETPADDEAHSSTVGVKTVHRLVSGLSKPNMTESLNGKILGYVGMVESSFGLAAAPKKVSVDAARKTVYVDKITSGKATSSIFTFYFKDKQIQGPPFTLKGKDEFYDYHYHLNGEDMARIGVLFPQIYSYRGGKAHDYLQLMATGFYDLMQSGKMVEALEMVQGKKFDEYEVLWQGPPPEMRESTRPKKKKPRIDLEELLNETEEK